MANDEADAVHVERDPAEPTGSEERLKKVRHDLRGALGIVQGALQTALDPDRPLAPEQRIELAAIARDALPELANVVEDYIATLENPGDIKLPD